MTYCLTAFACALAAAGCATSAPGTQAWPASRVAALAADRGCTTCHAERTARYGVAMPVAPSWRDIAGRYRRDSRAPDELSSVLVGGTVERHWKGSPFVAMLPHEKWVTPEEARELVRWILER